MSYAIGIDLGGTRIKLVAVEKSGNVIEEHVCATEDDATGRWAETIQAEVLAVEKRRGRPADWIGLAAPGLASRDGRSIAFMPGRLQGLEGLDWTEYIDRDNVVAVVNDAHAALLGESWRGAAQGLKNVAMLTLGTGVGGAAIVDGNLLMGHIGRAGHFGHICLDPDKPGDIVRTPGSLEDAIGNCTLEARSEGRFTTTAELLDAYRKGDRHAADVWKRSVHELSCAVTSIINVLEPEAIIIGGIAQAGKDLFDLIDAHLETIEWRPGGHRVGIVAAELGSQAGALGAAYRAIRRDELRL